MFCLACMLLFWHCSKIRFCLSSSKREFGLGGAGEMVYLSLLKTHLIKLVKSGCVLIMFVNYLPPTMETLWSNPWVLHLPPPELKKLTTIIGQKSRHSKSEIFLILSTQMRDAYSGRGTYYKEYGSSIWGQQNLSTAFICIWSLRYLQDLTWSVGSWQSFFLHWTGKVLIVVKMLKAEVHIHIQFLHSFINKNAKM